MTVYSSRRHRCHHIHE